jgi:hypothetical protein
MIVQAAENNALWCDAVCRANGAPGEFHADLWLNRHRVPRFYPNAVTLTPDGAAGQLARVAEICAARRAFAVKDSFAALDLRPLGFEVLFEAVWVGKTADGRRPAADHGRQTTDHKQEIADRGRGELSGAVSSGEQRSAVGGQRSSALAWSVVGGPDALARWEAAWAGLPSGQLVPESARIFRPSLLEAQGVAFLAGLRAGRITAVAAANLTGAVVGLSNVFTQEEDPAEVWAGAAALATALFPGRSLVGYERDEDLTAAQAAGFEPLAGLRVWVRDE